MVAVLNTILTEKVLVAGAIVGVIDLIFALNPRAKSNGFFHWVYLALSNIKNPSASA